MRYGRNLLLRIGRLIEKSGQNVHIIVNGEIRTGHAVLTPLRYKNRVYLEERRLAAGVSDGMHFSYVGSSELRLDLCDAGTRVSVGDEVYVLKIAEAIRFGEDVCAIWAILERYVPEAEGAIE